MKKIKLSVIVPCYNVSNYVSKSISSLCEQTLKEIEVIAINDGSTDNTLEVLNSLAKKYPNLKVIDKKNEGVSVARNKGLDIASGEYIGFLDSDDWVKKDCFMKLYNKAKEGDYDIVCCDTTAVYPDHEMVIKSNVKEDNDSVKNLMVNGYAVIWNKIYKKELLDDIRFKKGISFCEDVLFLFMVYSKIKKIGVVDEPLHYYLQREGSLTYVYDKKLYQLIDSLDNVIDFYKKEKKYDEYYEELEYSYVRYLLATFVKRLAKTKNKEEFKKGVKFVQVKVQEKFPNYKNNKYLRGNKKGLYLKYFNPFFANVIFMLEKNKMN